MSSETAPSTSTRFLPPAIGADKNPVPGTVAETDTFAQCRCADRQTLEDPLPYMEMMTLSARLFRPSTRSLAARLFFPALFLCLFVGAAACDAAPPKTPEEKAKILEVLALQPGEAVADVGAGDGEWAVEMAEPVGAEGRVYATEVDSGLVEDIRKLFEARGLPQGEVILGDDRSSGLPEACCDAILLRKVYHHFTDPEAMGLDLYRALKPGGRLVVIEYRDHMSTPVAGVPENRSNHGLAEEILVRELTAQGFLEVAVDPTWMGRDGEYAAMFLRPPAGAEMLTED